MQDSIKLKLLDKEISLDAAFNQINSKVAKKVILKEIACHHIFEDNFRQYNLQLAKDNSKINQELLEKLGKSLNLNSEKAWQDFYAKTNQNEEELLQHLLYQEQIENLKKEVISLNMIKDTFVQVKPQLDRVLFALIQIPFSNEALAKEILYRLRDDNHDFEELAQKYSSGAEAKQGGIIGPIALATLNPELKKHILALEPHSISDIFTLDNAFLIAKLIRLDSAQLNAYLENDLRNRLFKDWLDNQIKLINIQTVN